MQDVHIVYPFEHMLHRAEGYEQEFADDEAVAIIDWGCSYKQEQGYIVLEWDSEVDPDFLKRLDADHDVVDYSVYSVPCRDGLGVTTLPSEQASTYVA